MKNVNNDTIYLDGNNYKMNMFDLGLEFSTVSVVVKPICQSQRGLASIAPGIQDLLSIDT